MAYEIRAIHVVGAAFDIDPELQDALVDGWEPFSVTQYRNNSNNIVFTMFLRRVVQSADNQLVQLSDDGQTYNLPKALQAKPKAKKNKGQSHGQH